MSESLPTAILWLVGGLAVGTAGGYFWGVDSQLILDPQQQHATSQSSQNYAQQVASNATSTSAAIPDPTGLRLVGTVVQPERSKSMAWLLHVGADTTQSYKEGDALPGGYQLIAIGADDLQVSKNGSTFVIRRISSSSGQNNNMPCQAIAQNSRVRDSDEPERSSRAVRNGEATAGRNGLPGAMLGISRNLPSNQAEQQQTFAPQGVQSSQNAQPSEPSQSSQASQKSQKSFKGWGSKTIVDGDAAIDKSDGDVVVELPDNADTTH